MNNKLQNYAKSKLKLISDFKIVLPAKDKARILNSESETEIDNIVYDILHNRDNMYAVSVSPQLRRV